MIRLALRRCVRAMATPIVRPRYLSSPVVTHHLNSPKDRKDETAGACGKVPPPADGLFPQEEEDEDEQEEMFVEPHESFGHSSKEWGGPRRGGRFPEPTRYGDWERKGRCSDF